MSPDPVLVSVCGMGRSGKTVLGLMLGNAMGAFYCGEVNATYRDGASPRDLLSHPCSCGRPDCHVWERVGDPPRERVHATVAERMSVQRVVDSSHPRGWVEDSGEWAARSGMRQVRVLIWRQPLNRAHSIWKRAEAEDRPRRLDRAARVYVKRYRKLLASDAPTAVVSYEDLVASPAPTLRAVCAQLGLPYVEGQERFWEKPDHFRGGNGKVQTGLRRGGSGIWSPPEPPAEFLADVREHAPDLEDGKRVRKVVAELRRRSVA